METTSGRVGGQGAATRAAIAEAAGRLFTEHGYAGTSVRHIAAEAGVDAALVIRYFGGKERLFLETVQPSGFVTRALDGPVETVGERLARAAFAGDLEARLNVHRAMLRASGSDPIRASMLQAGEKMLVEPIQRLLAGPDARLRARLVAAQLNGLLTLLALSDDEDELRAEEARERLVAAYGRAIQTLVTPS